MWTTANATSASLDNGIGAVSVHGTQTVSPTASAQSTVTYTLTATGAGGTVHCSTDITVNPPPPSAPTCTLSASPSSVLQGGTSTLSWTTANATSFSIDNSIGSVSPVDAGSKDVSPSSTTTYTGTVTGPGGTAHCTTKVMVTPPPPTCTLTANPTTITQGDSSTLTWTTAHATDVSLDHGIGAVATNGSQSVAPAANDTYVLTATGAGGSVHCSVDITVNPPPPNAPTCTFSAAPASIVKGDSSTLSWTTTNATSVSIDQNIGSVSPVASGSKSVAPLSSTDYTLTAEGVGGKAVCTASVTVTSKPAPTCTLSATPASITKGDSTMLSWTTTNATSFSLDNNIGAVTPVDSGATSTTPSADTTYTGTVTGPGGTAHCDTKVTVTTPAQFSCTLTASASDVNTGDHVTLSWSAPGADTFSIDQGIGAVTPADSGTTTTKAIMNDTTFTGTAIAPSGKTVTCTADVKVSGGGGGGPSCTMTVSPSSIQSGQSAKLTWGGAEIKNVDIDNGIATATSSPGSATVAPTGVASYTYKGTFHATDGQTLSCEATLTVQGGGGGCTSNCGGGSIPPTVTLFSHPTTQPLAYLYLSQIPYTGLDLGTWGTALYWLGLVAWSLALAYLVLFGAVPLAAGRFRTFGTRVSEVLNAPPAPRAEPMRETAPAHAAPSVHAPAPMPSRPAPRATSPHGHFSAYEGFKSYAREGALTIEDIVKGLSREPSAAPAPHVEPIYENVEPVYDHVEPVYENVEPVYQNVEPVAPAPTVTRTARPRAEAAPVAAEVPAFIEVIVAGNREQAFAMLRSTIRSGGDAEAFLTQVACALDDAYRARLEGTPVHAEVERICKDCATPVLERLVTAFATAVDSSYSVGITGAKLALTRALATLGA